VDCSGFACLSVGLAILCNPLGFSVWLILLLVFMSLILLFGCSWNSHGMYDKVEFCSVYIYFFPFLYTVYLLQVISL